MADEYVYKISSRYLPKWLSYDIKHVENNQICPFWLFLFFERFWFFKNCFGSFFVFFAKIWPKNMHCNSISRFFRGLLFFTGWPETYDQLSYSIWRRISRATQLISRIFQILKIPKTNPQNFIFPKHFPLKIKNFRKTCNMLDGNGWWICI